MNTPIITLYGGPGTGKSTTAALVFGRLKQLGYNVELVNEYAKDLTWENRTEALGYQPYVAAKQLWRQKRLDGKVEAIITDTSILLGLIFGRDLAPEFGRWLLAEHERLDTLNVFLVRDPERAYNPNGRWESETEAQERDSEILRMLDGHGIEYHTIPVDMTFNDHVEQIVLLVMEKLRG